MGIFDFCANVCDFTTPSWSAQRIEAPQETHEEKPRRSYDEYVRSPSLPSFQIASADAYANGRFSTAQRAFLASYPQYDALQLDVLRTTEFRRLGKLVYLDYTGAALYPESLVDYFGEVMRSTVFGNPHSSNPPSRLAAFHTENARASVLQFFDADPDVYTVVWTANASSAMRIVGEGYAWNDSSRIFLGDDSHNSVNGVREFALRGGASVNYYNISAAGGWQEKWDLLEGLSRVRRPSNDNKFPGIFCLTGQSNITGYKAPLYLVQHAAAHGFHTLLDAAALAPTTPISLRDLGNTVDAMAISIYKITGFPTGIGALVVKKSFLSQLRKPWFAGGTVDVVHIPGPAHTLVDGSPRFEDGTINFLAMPAVPRGLSFISELLPVLPQRLACLTHWTARALSQIRHAKTGRPLVHVRAPSPSLTLASMAQAQGALVAFEVADALGGFVDCDAVEYGAGRADICLRSGCMCNPGGATRLAKTGYIMDGVKSDTQREELVEMYGVRAKGLLRASFGVASNFADAWALVEYMRSLAEEHAVERLLAEWGKDQQQGH